MEEYKVYVKINELGLITSVNSSAFLKDTTGWVEIGRYKHHHAQGNYFPESIYAGDGGAYRYKMVDGIIVECTPEEIAAQQTATNEPTLESRVNTLEEALEMILNGVTE